MVILAWIGVGLALLAAILFLPPLLAGRARAPGGGTLGPALSELNAAFVPAEHHAQAARRAPVTAERDRDEPPELTGAAVRLRVRDLAASIAFYADRLGFRIVEAHADRAILDLQGFRLQLESGEPVGPQAGAGLVFETTDLDAAVARLSAAGHTPDPPATGADGRRPLELSDPDGYPIRLESRR